MRKMFFKFEQAGDEPSQGSQVSASDIAALTNAADYTPNENDDDNDDSQSQESDEEKAAKELAAKKATQATEFTPSSKWDILKATEGFVMPEGLTTENESKFLSEAVMKQFGIEQQSNELHPLAKEIQEMAKVNPNITLQDIVGNVGQQMISLEGLSSDDKISLDLKLTYGEYDEEKNPDGMTPDDIQKFIDKLEKVDKLRLVKEIEGRVTDYNSKIEEDFKASNQQRIEAQYETTVKNVEKYIEELKENTKELNNIYGIPVNPEQVENFIEEFKLMSIPDKQTGISKLNEILSNDVLLMKLMFLAVNNGEEKVMEIITKGRESGKEQILQKLGLTPNFSGHRESAGTKLSHEDEIRLLTQA